MISPQNVAERLRTRILDLHLPPSTPLREMALAEEYGCSRRTVREALQLLDREGLLTVVRHRGAAVREFSPEDVRDLYLVRRRLEEWGAAACGSATIEQLAEVDHAFRYLSDVAMDNQDTAEHALADMRFHATVTALAGSPRLDHFFSSVAMEMTLLIRVLHRDEVRTAIPPDHVIADHRRIRDALIERDPLRAQQAVLDHIASNEARMVYLGGAPGR